MNESPFKAFIDLTAFDLEIAQLQNNEKKITQEIEALHQDEQNVLADVEKAKQAWQDAQKEVDAKELEMETTTADEAEKKRRLDLVSGHKEYKSLKTELETLQEKQQALEAALLDAWAHLESTARAHEAAKKSAHTQLEELQGKLTERMAQRAQVTTNIDQLKSERPAKEKIVPQEWLDKYATMRSQVLDPVVPVIRGVCSACDYKVSEQDMIMLGRNKLLQCKDCYRFLYLPDRTPSGQ